MRAYHAKALGSFLAPQGRKGSGCGLAKDDLELLFLLPYLQGGGSVVCATTAKKVKIMKSEHM